MCMVLMHAESRFWKNNLILQCIYFGLNLNSIDDIVKYEIYTETFRWLVQIYFYLMLNKTIHKVYFSIK